MRRVRTSLLLFIAGILLLLAHGIPEPARAPAPTSVPAPAVVSENAPAAPKKQSGCAAPVPRPLLQGDAYHGYSFEFGPENTAIEKATIGTISVEIQTSGCYDGVERGFLFENGAADAGYTDRDHWLLFAADQLRALKIYRRGQEDMQELLPFLAGAKSATTRMNDSELRLEVCRDRSAPTEDGCSYASGGGYRFSVRQLSPQRVGVYVSRYYALQKE